MFPIVFSVYFILINIHNIIVKYKLEFSFVKCMFKIKLLFHFGILMVYGKFIF